MEAIGRDDALIDPAELFRVSAAQSDIDTEDAAFWNVEVETMTDPLLQVAVELGATVTEPSVRPPDKRKRKPLLLDAPDLPAPVERPSFRRDTPPEGVPVQLTLF